MSVFSKRLNRMEEKGKGVREEEVVGQGEVVAEVVAVGASPIETGAYKVVAEVVAGVEGEMAEEMVDEAEGLGLGVEGDKDKVVVGKRVVRLLGDRKRRIIEGEEGRRGEQKETLVRAIPIPPRSGGKFGGVLGEGS